MATNLRIDWATHDAAKYACENWHYSRNLPTAKVARIGVWEKGKFIGALVFGAGATPNLLKPYGLDHTHGCELMRIALFAHQTPVSRIVSIAIKIIKRAFPKLRLIVSFADPSHGHYGGIYQAGGWIYSGCSQPDRFYKDKNGKIFHARQVTETKKRKKGFGKLLLSKNLKKIILPGKHRYLMPLDNDMRCKVETLRKPYPKRAVSKENVAVGFQPAEGGVNPTTALQTESIIKANGG